MKILLLFTFVILIVFSGFVFFEKEEEFPLSRGEQLVNMILENSAQKIKTKYKIRPVGEGAAMPGGTIKEFTLCFSTQDRLSKEQLRKLLIGSALELLNEVNANHEIQQFLINSPFTISNIQIIIYNHDKNGGDMYDPEISVAEIARGKLEYQTTDLANTFRYKNEFYETYKEASVLILN